MGSKVSGFRDISGIIKMVATFLTEGAVEVRNVAKRGLFSLQASLGGELDRYLMRSGINEK